MYNPTYYDKNAIVYEILDSIWIIKFNDYKIMMHREFLFYEHIHILFLSEFHDLTSHFRLKIYKLVDLNLMESNTKGWFDGRATPFYTLKPTFSIFHF